MSDQPIEHDRTAFSRRTFMRASGAAVGAGVLGTGATGVAAADDGEVPLEFMNARVQEAMQAWERGYRGRSDRSLAMTDSGLEARHPDVGPWNGITANTAGNGLLLRKWETGAWVFDVEEDEAGPVVRESGSFAGQNVGTGAFGLSNTHEPFTLDSSKYDVDDPRDPEGRLRLNATLTWEPSSPAPAEPTTVEMQLWKDGDVIGSAGGSLQVPEDNTLEVSVTERVSLEKDTDEEGDPEYQFYVIVWHGVADYQIEWETEEAQTYDSEAPMNTVQPGLGTEDVMPAEGEAPEMVCWHNDNTTYGDYDEPRDENGHGTHVSSIMGGSGRASAVDPDALIQDDPHAVLIAGQTLQYEVDAPADTGVFASGYGRGYEIIIEGPNGRQLARSNTLSLEFDSDSDAPLPQESNLNNSTVTETVHGDGTATYTVYYRANEGEAAMPAQVESIACGAFTRFDETAGDAIATDETTTDGLDGQQTVHAGVCPGNSLVAVTDLGTGTASFAKSAEAFVDLFNVRAVNHSWGYAGGAPIGAAGGLLDTTPANIKRISEAGIVPVAAAGNSYTPANGNSAPAVADEALSVVATGPRDGISVYSSGGVGGVDEDTMAPYAKPDVTAIGGTRTDYDMAAYIPEGGFDPETDDPASLLESNPEYDPESDETYGDIRTYEGLLGTSMASPSVCGTVGVLAQAMEEDAPAAMTFPAPSDMLDLEPADRRAKVLQLKSILLATASETAFTAAPYHRAKAPTYTHGERDPYEGYGRVNVGAAIDAATRDLTPADGATKTLTDTVGLDVPQDSRAIAGFVQGAGEVTVDLAFSHYGGANSGMTKGRPHLDLFVYDAEGFDALTGDPTIVASAQGVTGDASVTANLGAVDQQSGTVEEDTYLVVAKIVNVPGVVNGFDVQAYVDLEVSYEAVEVPDPMFTAEGGRSHDATVFTGGQVSRIQITLDDVSDEVAVVRVFDSFPEAWTLIESVSDGTEEEPGVIDFGPVNTNTLDDGETLTYYVTAPEGVEHTGPYTFGPAWATIVAPGNAEFANETAEFTGEQTVMLVGPGT